MKSRRRYFLDYVQDLSGGPLCPLLLLYLAQDSLYGHTYGKGMGQPAEVANPARGQLNRENEYSPVPVRA